MSIDRDRYTAVGHQGMTLWHPHDPGALERLIDAAGLGPQSTALDIGCGRAEVVLRISERTGAAARAIDASPIAIDAARQAAAERDPDGRLTLDCARFDPARAVPADLVVCIGSTHVVGGFEAGLPTLIGLMRPGGRLLIGDGFWASEPDPAWLERRFGGDRGAFSSWDALLASAWAAGLTPIATHRVSADGWRAYETRHNANIRASEGPDADAMRARSDSWFGDWKRWGAALGFGLWLFAQRPEQAGADYSSSMGSVVSS